MDEEGSGHRVDRGLEPHGQQRPTDLESGFLQGAGSSRADSDSGAPAGWREIGGGAPRSAGAGAVERLAAPGGAAQQEYPRRPPRRDERPLLRPGSDALTDPGSAAPLLPRASDGDPRPPRGA